MKHKFLTLTRDDYVKLLKNSTCKVVFEKVNGDLREMFCTLDPTLIPKTIEEATKEVLDTPKRKTNDSVVAVFDLQAQAWRAFRINSVLAIKKLT